jgi:nucleoside phosphorylase
MDSPKSELRTTVFTAIATETDAVLGQLESFDSEFIGDLIAHTGLLKDTASPCRITILELGPGNIETAMEAGRVRGDGSADILLFVGIAGALKDLDVGDVVAAHEVVWLHRTKVTDGEFQYRPQISQCTRELVQVARYTAGQASWRNRLAIPVKESLKAIVGQILSGEELIKDSHYKARLKKLYSDAIAVDNEGYGLARAGSASLRFLSFGVQVIMPTRPRPTAIRPLRLGQRRRLQLKFSATIWRC